MELPGLIPKEKMMKFFDGVCECGNESFKAVGKHRGNRGLQCTNCQTIVFYAAQKDEIPEEINDGN